MALRHAHAELTAETNTWPAHAPAIADRGSCWDELDATLFQCAAHSCDAFVRDDGAAFEADDRGFAEIGLRREVIT